jgi:ubiquinone/menaquinone biosynthesis C-methylase UbiE
MGYYLLNRVAIRARGEHASLSLLTSRKMRRLELAKRLAGINTRAFLRQAYTDWDWSERGEEWTLSPEWRESVVEELLRPNLPPGPVTLEIGPGAGRWSGVLQAESRRLVLADITERTLQICRERFAACDNVEYHLTDGTTLPEVGSETIDFVWSFDVFVHIAPSDQREYLREVARVMRPGARAVIHHAGKGGVDDPTTWRSSMTATLFAELLQEAGLRLISQVESWGDGFETPVSGDVVTIFER